MVWFGPQFWCNTLTLPFAAIVKVTGSYRCPLGLPADVLGTDFQISILIACIGDLSIHAGGFQMFPYTVPQYLNFNPCLFRF